MPKELKINKRVSYKEICGIYETEKDGRMKVRVLAIKYAYEGKKSEEIAKMLNKAGSTIRIYMNRWNRCGYEGLRDIPHPEVEKVMTEEEMAKIDKALKKKSA